MTSFSLHSMTRGVDPQVLLYDYEATQCYQNRIHENPAFELFEQTKRIDIDNFIQSCVELIKQIGGSEKKGLIPKVLNGPAQMVFFTRKQRSAVESFPQIVDKEGRLLVDIAREPLSEEELNNVLHEWAIRVHECVMSALRNKPVEILENMIVQRAVALQITPTNQESLAAILDEP